VRAKLVRMEGKTHGAYALAKASLEEADWSDAVEIHASPGFFTITAIAKATWLAG